MGGGRDSIFRYASVLISDPPIHTYSKTPQPPYPFSCFLKCRLLFKKMRKCLPRFLFFSVKLMGFYYGGNTDAPKKYIYIYINWYSTFI